LPCDDGRLRVIAGLIRTTNTSNAEVQYLSATAQFWSVFARRVARAWPSRLPARRSVRAASYRGASASFRSFARGANAKQRR
jgi:hypothetical protein